MTTANEALGHVADAVKHAVDSVKLAVSDAEGEAAPEASDKKYFMGWLGGDGKWVPTDAKGEVAAQAAPAYYVTFRCDTRSRHTHSSLSEAARRGARRIELHRPVGARRNRYRAATPCAAAAPSASCRLL